MALQSYSILYLNLVCEMIYVIAERLKMQKIPIDKSKLVLNDIIAASFNCRFLFAPTITINRDILNKNICCAVHSSIMRLNESSMDKLIGLIETSVKMQMFSTNGPRQVLLITLNHLDSVRELACTNQLKQSLDLVQYNFYQTFEKMTNGELMRLRYTLLNYLQDVNVKVTIFIKEGLQRYNGSFVSIGKWAIPYGCEMPGVIRIYDKNSTLIDISTFHPISFYKVETEIGSIKPNCPRITSLGLSIYNNNKNINEQSKTFDVFNEQTGRDGYKQEMDLFVTQLMGNQNQNKESNSLDLEIFETSFNNEKKILEEKLPEYNILNFSQNTSNKSLQNLKIEMNDTDFVSRETDNVLNLMQLLDKE